MPKSLSIDGRTRRSARDFICALSDSSNAYLQYTDAYTAHQHRDIRVSLWDKESSTLTDKNVPGISSSSGNRNLHWFYNKPETDTVRWASEWNWTQRSRIPIADSEVWCNSAAIVRNCMLLWCGFSMAETVWETTACASATMLQHTCKIRNFGRVPDLPSQPTGVEVLAVI